MEKRGRFGVQENINSLPFISPGLYLVFQGFFSHQVVHGDFSPHFWEVSLFSHKHVGGSSNQLLTSLPPDCKHKYSIQPALHRARGLGTWIPSQGSQRWVLTSMWGICSAWTLELLFLNSKLPLSPGSLQQVYAARPLPPGSSRHRGPFLHSQRLGCMCVYSEIQSIPGNFPNHTYKIKTTLKKPKIRVDISYGVSS